MKKEVIVLHDVDGRIYFQALQQLSDSNKIGDITYYEIFVIRKILSSIVKRRFGKTNLKRILNNIKFRLSVPFIKDKIIILGVAPYNFRFFWYSILARKNRVVYHTSWPFWWTDDVPCKYGFFDFPFKLLYQRILNNSNIEFVCVTQPVKDSLSKNIKNKRIEIIPHAVDLKNFHRDFNFDYMKRNCEKTNVLFVGRMVKEKGVHELIELCKEFTKKHHFTFVGVGDQLDKMRSELSQNSNVTFLGLISDKIELAKIFKKNDLLLLPSKKVKGWEELFGMVIIEAMAAGLIVAATNHIGPRGIITNNFDGILVEEKGLTETLRNILYDFNSGDEKWDIMRKNAMLSARAYSLEEVKMKWLKVIDGE